MLKILFVINLLITIIALVFWIIGIKHFKNDEYSTKGIKYILVGTQVTGICVILSSILFSRM